MATLRKLSKIEETIREESSQGPPEELSFRSSVTMLLAKTAFDERYHRVAGTECDVEAIRRSAEILMGSEVDYEFRTTVCPAFVGLDDLLDVAKELHGAKRYILQEFRPGDCLDPAMNEVEPCPRETLREFAAQIDPLVGLCIVRGDWPGPGAG